MLNFISHKIDWVDSKEMREFANSINDRYMTYFYENPYIIAYNVAVGLTMRIESYLARVANTSIVDTKGGIPFDAVGNLAYHLHMDPDDLQKLIISAFTSGLFELEEHANCPARFYSPNVALSISKYQAIIRQAMEDEESTESDKKQEKQ